MNLIIRPVNMLDLNAVVKIESQAFSMNEDMTRKDMIGRIKNYPDTFLVAEVDYQLVGHIFGPAFNQPYIRDEIYFENHPNRKADQYQTVLSLAVSPEFRKQGIATELLDELSKVAKSQNRLAITLICLPKLISFYEKRGFVNKGKTSDDIPDPDDESSYNMVKEL